MKQVTGESVASGDPQEGLEASACSPLSGPQGLLGDLQSFWGGEKGTGGDEEGWKPGLRVEQGTPWELGSTERKLPPLHSSKVPCLGERLEDVGVGG